MKSVSNGEAKNINNNYLDPEKVCGNLWFNGTDEQRAGFGKGTEGRARDERPPGAWWDDCIKKIEKSETNIKIPESTTLPGGKYIATQNANQTWNIVDVPIFAEHTSPYDKEKKIDKKWLESSIKRAQERLNEGYIAPLHIHHHSTGQEIIRAGYILPKEVKKMKYDGNDVHVLFADLVEIPNEIYAKIKKGELPYRSVEILDVDKPEIASLALLDTEVPFFRFPLLTIGREKKAGDAEHFKNKSYSGYRTLEHKGALILCSFRGYAMPEDVKKEEEKKEEEKKEEVKMQEGTDASGKMMELLTKIYEMLSKMMPPTEQKNDTTPVDVTGKASSETAYNAKLAGKLSALEGKIEVIEKEKKISQFVADALAKLNGYHISQETAKELYQLAMKDGISAVDSYVAAVKKYGVKEPPTSIDNINNPEVNDCKEVAFYAQYGPESLEKARKFRVQYNQLKENKYTTQDLKSFLEDSFAYSEMIKS